MATNVAIAYPDQGTAEQARATVFRLEDELILRAEPAAPDKAIAEPQPYAAEQTERGTA